MLQEEITSKMICNKFDIHLFYIPIFDNMALLWVLIFILGLRLKEKLLSGIFLVLSWFLQG